MAGPRNPPVRPCSPSATSKRLERVTSSNSPPGSWLNKPAKPPALRTKPMFSWLHPSTASRTATNGPNPDCIPARKKLSQSRPVRLESDGDMSSAPDGAVMAMAEDNALCHGYDRFKLQLMLTTDALTPAVA